jgi:hypothetical protein
LAEVTSKVEAAEDAVRVAKENAILDMQKLTKLETDLINI